MLIRFITSWIELFPVDFQTQAVQNLKRSSQNPKCISGRMENCVILQSRHKVYKMTRISKTTHEPCKPFAVQVRNSGGRKLHSVRSCGGKVRMRKNTMKCRDFPLTRQLRLLFRAVVLPGFAILKGAGLFLWRGLRQRDMLEQACFVHYLDGNLQPNAVAT